MNRGARHQPVFGDDVDRMRFLGLLSVAHERFGVETQAYCLMGNHYHLLLHCPDGLLSRAMHYIGTVYTQKFNRKYELDGALFRGRFHSLPITTDQYLLEASRYIHRNPAELHLPEELWDYRWSSYGIYLGLRPSPEWLGRPLAMSLMNNNVHRYREYVQTPRSDKNLQLLERSLDPESAGRLERARDNVPALDALDLAVLSATGATSNALRQSATGQRNLTRLAAVLLAVEDTAVSVDQVASRYCLSSRSSVWSTVRRARDAVRSDPTFASVVSRARSLIREPTLRDIA